MNMVYISGVEARNANLTYHVGDANITIREVLLDENNRPIDLTGATVVFEVLSQSQVLLTSTAATIDFALGGIVSALLTTANLATKGTYYRRWVATWGDGTVSVYPRNTNLSILVQ